MYIMYIFRRKQVSSQEKGQGQKSQEGQEVKSARMKEGGGGGQREREPKDRWERKAVTPCLGEHRVFTGEHRVSTGDLNLTSFSPFRQCLRDKALRREVGRVDVEGGGGTVGRGGGGGGTGGGGGRGRGTGGGVIGIWSQAHLCLKKSSFCF